MKKCYSSVKAYNRTYIINPKTGFKILHYQIPSLSWTGLNDIVLQKTSNIFIHIEKLTINENGL